MASFLVFVCVLGYSGRWPPLTGPIYDMYGHVPGVSNIRSLHSSSRKVMVLSKNSPRTTVRREQRLFRIRRRQLTDAMIMRYLRLRTTQIAIQSISLALTFGVSASRTSTAYIVLGVAVNSGRSHGTRKRTISLRACAQRY